MSEDEDGLQCKSEDEGKQGVEMESESSLRFILLREQASWLTVSTRKV